MLKAGGGGILSQLPCILFNRILDRGRFPEQWTRSIWCPLHKKVGPISLLSVTVNNRLNTWAETHGLLREEQDGYRQGYSTLDQIFLLNCIAEKYITKKKGRFYCAFITFLKRLILYHTL